MQQPDWHGFIPNTFDTKILSSYCDENFSNGLKQNSKRYLGYDQVEYKQLMRVRCKATEKPYKGGRIIKREEVYPQVEKIVKGEPVMVDDKSQEPETFFTYEYRMNEVPAKHVLDYGCDDTICTAALFNHYRMVMELENTWHLYEEVEQKPSYLTAQAFVQGCRISVERMKELEKEDDEAFDAARTILVDTLNAQGLIEKMWEPYTDNRCADFVAAFEALYGYKIESKVRTHSKLADLMRADPDLVVEADHVQKFIDAVERQDIGYCNALLYERFKKDPAIDMGSPKQMRKFLYEVLKLPVRVVNDPTDLEWKEKKEMAEVLRRFKQHAIKGEDMVPTKEELVHLIAKAKTDDTAVGLALVNDCEEHPIAKTVLTAMQEMKSIMTRRSLYYSKYPHQKHWKDGMVHAGINQCATVTRRYSSSGPNLQQLPKKGEGVKVRQIILPHHRDAVIVSLDYSGQELRLAADCSGDENMLACYIGDNLKDPHSITAAGAMDSRWGKAKVAELMKVVGWQSLETDDERYEFFCLLRESEDDKVRKLAGDLRKNSKNVNFLAQYDGQALTLSYDMLLPVKVCQEFLDAKYAMFPRVETWKEEVRARVMSSGYAETLLGARRHLAKLMFDRATASKAGRQGPNFVIQGSAAEQTKLGMAAVWDSGVTYNYDCRFIAPIHDELVFSIHKDHAVEAIKIIHAAMVRPYAGMKVPCVSEISLGPNFGVQIEIGPVPDAAKIQAALDEVFNKQMEAA